MNEIAPAIASGLDTDAFPPEMDDSFFRRLVTKAHYELWRAGVPGREDPTDVAQDVLIQLFHMWTARELVTTDPTALLRGLAGLMVRRRAIDCARRLCRQPAQPAPHAQVDLVGTSAALDHFEAQITGFTTHFRRLDRQHRVTGILSYVAELETSGRVAAGSYQLLVWHLVDDLSYEEIAVQQGRGENPEALRSRLRRLKERIRKRFPRCVSG